MPSTSNQSASASATAAAAILADIEKKYEQVKKVNGLREAIKQVEDGEVKAIRDALGRGHPRWLSIKSVITRREKVYRALLQDFEGDKEKFFAYFTRPIIDTTKRRKSALSVDDENLYSFSDVAERLIPAMVQALVTEKKKEKYMENGKFSDALWKENWGDMNRFMIWDSLKAEANKGEMEQQQQLD